ncbi:MAG: adenylate/guanylate cyclase domain-containing protein [Cyanobacteriota bacterium]
MSFLNKMTSKVQETAAATKLLAKLNSGKQISTQVVEAYLKKDFSRVISLVESILDEENDNRKAEAYLTLGNMCLVGNNFTLAEECLEKSLKLNHSNKAYELLGETYINSNNYNKALEVLKKCLEMNYDPENIYLNLINIYKYLKDYNNLMDTIWKYIQKYGKTNWAWNSDKILFNQKELNKMLNLKSPGSALAFVLNEIVDTEPPDTIIKLSDSLISKPFPIFTEAIEEAAFRWIRANSFYQLKMYAKAADEWRRVKEITNLPPILLKWADAEWRANELACHFDTQILNKIFNRETTALQGQFMKATILICDIRGFSRFSYEFRHAPQVILQFLKPYFDSSQDIITKYNGILDKYLGDGFISFFVPSAQDEPGYQDSVVRATKSGIELQKYFNDNLPEWADIWKRNLDETTYHEKLVDQIGLGIGIHTGFVFLGEVGTEKRSQYTVLGNVVNFTARLQGKAACDHIVFSAPVYEYLKNISLKYKVEEMPEDCYSDLKNIPGSYKLYFLKYTQ